MTEKPSLSDQHIIDCLNSDYGIQVAQLTFIPLGADIDAAVYKAQTNDQSYFVKLNSGNHQDIGPIIQLLLHDAGIHQIISPIKTNNGNPMCHIDDFTLIVYPFIEGQDGFSKSLTDDQWIALGKALKLVHEFHLPAPIKDQIKRESYSPQWREAVRSLYARIDAQDIVTDEIALKLATFMKEHRDTIQQVVDRAEQLEHIIKNQSPKFVLCHSDIHAGNVLLEDDGALYIVDWDQPIMAPKERDLMFIGGGVGTVWNDPHEEQLFYQGYGKTEINKEILAYYRYERIVEDIAEYGNELLLKSEGGKDRQMMYKHFLDMFEPRGVVDIAFKTDTNV